MKRNIIFLIIFIYSSVVFGQVAFILNTIPNYTPEDDIIYLAGDINGWDPGNPDFALEKDSDGVWNIILPEEPSGTSIQYKFTRGDWGTVEKGSNGEEIANREFVYGNGDTVYVDILNWADNGGGGSSTAAENVSILDDNFFIPQLNRNRRIWIYLPPDYDISNLQYPVLYMHDGQNLFDSFTSFAGEWEVDETLNELWDEGYQVPIVIGIDNGGTERINEYTPWINQQYGGGQGAEYVDFLVNTLKPYVDENYRTLSDRENTGVMGSSLGGLISQYAAIKYQSIYGKSGIFSPAYWISDSVWGFTSMQGKQFDIRFYQLIGSLEGSQYINGMWNMHDTLSNMGFNENEIFSVEIPNGNHNEALWRDNFREAYLWLFSEYASLVNDKYEIIEIQISPNPVSDFISLSETEIVGADSVKVVDMSGNIILAMPFVSVYKINVSSLLPGNYILIISGEEINYRARFIKK